MFLVVLRGVTFLVVALHFALLHFLSVLPSRVVVTQLFVVPSRFVVTEVFVLCFVCVLLVYTSAVTIFVGVAIPYHVCYSEAERKEKG